MNVAVPFTMEALPARIATLLEASASVQDDTICVGQVSQLFGGNARKAYAFDITQGQAGEEKVLPCVMLSAVGGRHVESNLGWEYEILSRLRGRGVRSPAALAVDIDGTVVGAPSLILERIAGKTSVVEFLAAPAESESQGLTEDLARVAAELHNVDLKAGGFELGGRDLDPLSLAREQIAHWQRIFEEQRLEPHPAMSWLFAWLHEHLPVPQRIGLVHGDMRPGNFLYQGRGITALLDWEMAHFGDPLEDIGWIYRPMWSPQKFINLPDFLKIYARYAQVEPRWQDVLYYRIFSEIKFATISLTAAANFARGMTLNLRHADRASMVNSCLSCCIQWIEQKQWEPTNA